MIIHKEESYAVMGACFEVYKDKGPGFVEPIYHECLEIEFTNRKLPAVSKPKLQIEYKGVRLKHGPEPDFVCFGKILLLIMPSAVLLSVWMGVRGCTWPISSRICLMYTASRALM